MTALLHERWNATLLDDGETQEDVPVAGAPFRFVDICHACGATVSRATGTPYVRRGDAHFCHACWQRLTAIGIAAVVREVALRGVPYS